MSEAVVLKKGKFLELVEHKTRPLLGEKGRSLSIQIRLTKDHDIVAYVEHSSRWRMWAWQPLPNFEHSASCTREIAGFMDLLDNERPGGELR